MLGSGEHSGRLEIDVPSAGPAGAMVAFVGASPSPIDAIRKSPIVGPAGALLRDRYLAPLGLSRADVFVTNVVPQLLVTNDGRPREPTAKELARWRPWLDAELQKAAPRIVIALGQTARRALADRADFVLPHPNAVLKFGDKGEVARKIARIRTVLEALQDAPAAGETVKKSYVARLLKAVDDERQLIYGIVLEPDTVDAQGDIVRAADIEKAAHAFLIHSRVVGDMHTRPAEAEVVESYIAPADFTLGGQVVKRGSWVMVVHVSDPELWAAVKDGKYTGFSVGGFGRRIRAGADVLRGVA